MQNSVPVQFFLVSDSKCQLLPLFVVMVIGYAGFSTVSQLQWLCVYCPTTFELIGHLRSTGHFSSRPIFEGVTKAKLNQVERSIVICYY